MLTVVLIILLVVAWVLYKNKKPKNCPPGPVNIPLVGRAFAMNQNHPEKAFVEWQRQYGPLYSVKMGPSLVVVISDPALLREAFNKPASTGRMAGPVLEMLGVQRGLILSVG
ncbi:putative cytochrome P450 515B1 [Amphibalanus amphitrite]|uniref:Putative cytochrome P450 515B1 n=1 Tax=Amphibalanus amphitrite TaxID=1232801 RepID=A0A6A4V832_AMPAM|nr:putative cytochrome P450 515B1 [Amphibalanus amphitrite]